MSSPRVFTVLNVDDSRDVLYLRSYILRSAGFTVLEAMTGNDALEAVSASRPEIALLDVNLPDLSGTEVCRRIKSNPETASTLVVQISAKFTASEHRLQGLESGADGYLTDPVEPELLVATIRSLLRIRETLERTRKSERTLDVLMQHVPEGITIADAPDVTVRRVSRYGLDLLGVPHASADGVDDHRPERYLLLTPEGRPALPEQRPIRRATQKGEVVKDEEWILVRSDGSRIPILCNAAPIRNESGVISGGVVAWRDIRDLKRTQKSLEVSNEFLALANTSVDIPTLVHECLVRIERLAPDWSAGIYVSGADGRITHMECGGANGGLQQELALHLSADGHENQIRAACERFGFPKIAIIPIEAGGRRLGLIHLADTAEPKVEPEIIRLVETAAAQLGPAIERLAGKAELQRAHDQLEIRVSDRTAELASVNQELDKERRKLFQLLDGLPSFVCLQRPDCTVEYTNRRFREIFGEPASRPCYKVMAGREQPCEDCPASKVVQTKTPVEREWTSPDGRHYLIHHYPFSSNGDKLLVMELGTDITERKKSEQALRHSEEQLRILSGRLLAAQESERSRIARELHDELGQAITVLKLRVGSVGRKLSPLESGLRQECDGILSYIDQMIESVRRISRDLSPSIIEDLGLTAALRRLVQDFASGTGLQLSAEIGSVDALLPKDLYIVLYRIVQEALTNAARHSNARTVSLTVRGEADGLFCQVVDDGRGMDPKQSVPHKGLGLATMRERVHMLGSVLQISGRPGEGTTIRFLVPGFREQIVRSS